MVNLNSVVSLNEVIAHTCDSLEREVFLSVDNRELNENNLFIAIVGEKYNPLKYLEKVMSSGCKLVAYEEGLENERLVAEYNSAIKFIKVKSITDFIQSVGELVAEQFKERGGKIIGIAGSNGKTTSKEMLFHILNGIFPNKVICTQKNNNNHLGVPFTLYQITKTTKFAIIELGSNHPGEIEHLAKMIKPQYGVTTNIGDTHLEFFGNRESVFEEESKIYDHTSEVFFKNSDDKHLSTLKDSKRTKMYGVNGADFKFKLGSSSMDVNRFEIKNDYITGDHNYINLGLAFIISDTITDFEITERVVELASKFKPTANRSEWIKLNNKNYFLDAYNANPSSMKLAVDGFMKKITQDGISLGEICLILGDMNELGSNASSYHKEVGEYILSKNAGMNIFVGKFADDYAGVSDGSIYKFSDVDSMASRLITITENIRYFFIKGSRSLQLERILDIK